VQRAEPQSLDAMEENHAVDVGMGISTVILLSLWEIRLQSMSLLSFSLEGKISC
jgi:hypothetical protein